MAVYNYNNMSQNPATSAAGQFRAEAGKTYVDSAGRSVSFTPEDLKTVGIGQLSSDFKVAPNNGMGALTPPPTTTPGVISSDNLNSRLTNGKKETDDYYAQLEKERAQALLDKEAALNARELEQKAAIERIQNKYNILESDRTAQQKEERATEAAIQFRLGQSGTEYALSQTEKANKVRENQLALLRIEKEQLINEAKAAYAMGDAKTVEMFNKQLSDLSAKQYDIQREYRKDALAELTYERQNRMADYSIAKTQMELMSDIPEGETRTFNIGGVDIEFTGVKPTKPFFDADYIKSIQLKLNKGEVFKTTDPNTGKEVVITGIIEQPDKTIQVTSNDGTIRMLKPDGKGGMTVVGQSAPGVGKTGGSGTNVSVTMPSYSNVPFYVNGKQAGVVRFDAKSNKNIIMTNDNKELQQLPTGATLGTFAAGNPTEDNSGWGALTDTD